MHSHAQIITTPTADTPGTTVLLHFDSKRYLIGSMAEGTQRASVQMGTKLIKVSECFITGRTEWKNTGGLIGMILTLADTTSSSNASSLEEALRKARSKAKRMGVLAIPDKVRELEDEAKKAMTANLTIFGPPNLNHTLATARRFVFRKGLPVNVHEVRDIGTPEQNQQHGQDWKPFWADQNIKVWAMSISPSIGATASVGSSKSSPVSPRKRSFDEMEADTGDIHTAINSDLTPEERNYLEVKAVVSEMFNSSWRLDTLHETPLSQVNLPAAMFIRNPETNKLEKYTGPLPGDIENPPPPDLQVLVRKPWPGALVESLPETRPTKEAISYIVKTHMQRGKFRPENARALKVKPGERFSKLAAGENVLNDDGETVTPEQVMDPPRAGGGIAVVDLPEVEYIDGLIARPEWRSQQVMEGVGAVIWNCGKGVASDSRLHDFMREFKHLEHVVSAPDYCPNNIALDSVAASTIRLRRVDPARYVVPVHDAEGTAPQCYGGNADYLKLRASCPLPEHAHIAARGQIVQLLPKMELRTTSIIPALKIPEVEADVTENVMQEAIKAQEASKSPDEDASKWLATLPPGADNAEIITLGTGSALPSKYRNVSATLVLVPGWGNILFDCGENTLGQLKRVFPPAEFKQVLQDLRVLTISHMHADHQLGTTSVIKAWYDEVHDCKPVRPVPTDRTSDDVHWEEVFSAEKRLAVITEPAMQLWLHEYSAVEDFGYSRIAPLILDRATLSVGPSRMNWFLPPSVLKGLNQADRIDKIQAYVIDCALLNLKDIQAAAVRHCYGARAVSITLPSGFKVSYSGDCRPSHDFVQIGRGSTVCIHEATFDDERLGDAQAKQHSTTSEALRIAQRMNARACVLTHFSQRYQKVPVLEREQIAAEPDAGFAATADEIAWETKKHGSSYHPLEESHQELAEEVDDDPAASFPDAFATKHISSATTNIINPTDRAPEVAHIKLKSDMKVAIAFDYMRVKVGDIWQMEKFTPALLKLFEDEEVKEQKEKQTAFFHDSPGIHRKKGKGSIRKIGQRNVPPTALGED